MFYRYSGHSVYRRAYERHWQSSKVSLDKLVEFADKVTNRNSNALIAATEFLSGSQAQNLAELVKKVEA